MRVATFSLAGERRVGLVDLAAQTVAPFDLAVERAEAGLLALIERNGAGLPRTLSPIPLARVDIEAPIPQPRRNIFCVGKNYYEHAHEFARSGFDSSAGAGAVPKHPIIFSKVPESVVANHASVQIDPSVSTAIDYEAELAVIIGTGGRGISKEEALDHVWGYTIVNDVTARDLQGKYSQWLIGKSQDTFCPMGPWAVTRDEFDLANAGIRCFVNEDLRQDSRISLLIFDIPTIIATLSQGITLRPGDIIATGTPVGVGIGFDPPKYLKPGDVVRIEIDGIGTLENRFVERPQ
ncbi:fumarylacetoacetate hydrolase family protein [Mesorhizobium sp. GbtcB19]|uniref:fumarylacetoacetate hydrolase family protein n=1 Tax=Mesorhizobium sp. GbtcB19 TaxID=2824764 RepID=UPI001C2F826C|nr:fumarylacetoacetate hydrolase family protein [Mesorhizobium sp. GbtcB19]